MKEILNLALIEDNPKLRIALKEGLESTNKIKVVAQSDIGLDSILFCEQKEVDVILMDVQLKKENGIYSAIQLRKEFPRKPIVFYSIQDDDQYFKDFIHSGILSHYAYVKKSNYLLPSQLVPLLKDAFLGKSFIDPEIETRVKEVRFNEKNSPRAMLEPRELEVAKFISQGLTNEQIANILKVKDKRTISRINGQIYSLWNLDSTAMDEKVARTRAVIIYNENKFIEWNEKGKAHYYDQEGNLKEWNI
jgi:DNA-binding NarL/FixJ family response regulator